MTSAIAQVEPAFLPALQGSASGVRAHLFTGASTGYLYPEGAATYRSAHTTTVSVLDMRTRLVGSATVASTVPFGTFKDFAHFTAAMPDPAMVLIRQNASGLATYDVTQPSFMRRVWATTEAPQDYPVSSGYAWRRAAFAGVGVRVNQMTPNSFQYIDGAQFEMTPLSTSGPTPYSPARSLQVNVNPDRLNYCSNPSFEIDTSAWTTVGGCSLTRSTAQASQGLASGLVTWATGAAYGQAVTHTLNGLIPGSDYVAAVDVLIPMGGPRVVLDVTGATGSPVSSATTHNNVWERLTVTFTASTSTATLRVVCFDAATAGMTVAIDGVVVERGTVAGDYFDGGSGDDYLWEAGGTAGKARAYYYRDRSARAYLLRTLLQENCPLGVIPSVPQYAVLPTVAPPKRPILPTR